MKKSKYKTGLKFKIMAGRMSGAELVQNFERAIKNIIAESGCDLFFGFNVYVEASNKRDPSNRYVFVDKYDLSRPTIIFTDRDSEMIYEDESILLSDEFADLSKVIHCSFPERHPNTNILCTLDPDVFYRQARYKKIETLKTMVCKEYGVDYWKEVASSVSYIDEYHIAARYMHTSLFKNIKGQIEFYRVSIKYPTTKKVARWVIYDKDLNEIFVKIKDYKKPITGLLKK